MNRDPMDSFDKPFYSGDGLCYPIYAKNYYKTQTTPMFGGRKTKKSQKGGNTIGNYSQPSTPSDYPGNAYLSSPNQRNALTGSGVPEAMNPLTERFLNSNMGITYATQAGGGRRKNKRGGIGANEFNSSAGVMNQQNNQNSGTLKRAEKQQSGGKNVVQEELPYAPSQVLSASPPTQGVYKILSGGKYKKYSKKGGNPDSASIPLEITESFASMMSGGRYKKYSKKGGNYIFTPGANFSSQPPEIATMTPLAQAQHIPEGGYDMKDMSGVDAQMAASDPLLVDIMSGGRKKSSRKLKGGVSDFATTLASRGPINYPDALSAQRFRYFNKTGTFIPNTMLQYAAAPISTGYEADQNPYPMAYNDYIGGAAKKTGPAKKKTAPAKKKAAPAKKKSTSDKKKKSASNKKKK